jgi:hypothetical protein
LALRKRTEQFPSRIRNPLWRRKVIKSETVTPLTVLSRLALALSYRLMFVHCLAPMEGAHCSSFRLFAGFDAARSRRYGHTKGAALHDLCDLMTLERVDLAENRHCLI